MSTYKNFSRFEPRAFTLLTRHTSCELLAADEHIVCGRLRLGEEESGGGGEVEEGEGDADAGRGGHGGGVRPPGCPPQYIEAGSGGRVAGRDSLIRPADSEQAAAAGSAAATSRPPAQPARGTKSFASGNPRRGALS